MEDENQVKKSLIESNFNEDSLYDYLKTHSKMLVLKEDEEYEQYIPSKPRLTSEEIIEKVEDTVNNYCTSQFVGLLEKMGYIILPELPETV
jgi:hypothetical protein